MNDSNYCMREIFFCIFVFYGSIITTNSKARDESYSKNDTVSLSVLRVFKQISTFLRQYMREYDKRVLDEIAFLFVTR